ncbi:MAG: NADPH-dependent oxidoreductase [Planctomycetes bacterium]|nr:NADPH-dependent oxidoreductase [Planctomycetota bacterium]
MNETIALLQKHRSIRSFKSLPIPEEHILAAVASGQMASSSSNIQSYCLIRITDPRKRQTLVELTGGQPKVAESGAFFVVCGDTRRHRLMCEKHEKKYDAKLEAFLLALVDATLFAQNLVLAFESLGYGICFIGGLRNNLPESGSLLEIPTGVYPFYGLCVGSPDHEPPLRPRLPLEAVYFEDRYPPDDVVLGRLEAYNGAIREFEGDRGEGRSSWIQRMAEKFSRPQRTDIAAYYRSQGADLG